MSACQRLTALEAEAFREGCASKYLPGLGLLVVYPRPYSIEDQRAFIYTLTRQEIDAETAGRALLISSDDPVRKQA